MAALRVRAVLRATWALKEEVERLRAKDPQDYDRHPTTVLLATVYKAITELVPPNPDQSEFRVRAVEAAGLAWNDKAHSAIYDAERTAEVFCEVVNRWNGLLGPLDG